MKSSATTSMFAAACVAAASAAHASDFTDKSSLVLFAGGNAEMPGSFRGQTVPFDSVDPTGSTVYHDLKFEDAYDHRYTMGAEFDYAVNSELAAFGRYGYSTFNGTEHVVGEFTPSPIDTAQPVSAKFGDTDTQEIDIGARYTFAPGAKFRPFVGAALGAEHLGATRAEFANVSGVGTTEVVLGKADLVFQQRFETGLQYSPLQNFDLRLTAAATHVDADTRSDDPNLALVGLDNTQADVRAHWTYPVELGAAWHF